VRRDTRTIFSSLLKHYLTGFYSSIQDGGVTVFWGVAYADVGSRVSIGAGTGSEKQKWVLEKVG